MQHGGYTGHSLVVVVGMLGIRLAVVGNLRAVAGSRIVGRRADRLGKAAVLNHLVLAGKTSRTDGK